MADEKLMAQKTSTLSSKLVLHDISATLITPATSPLLPRGVLFTATPPVHATLDEKRMLRDKLQIKTVITTTDPQTKRYIQNEGTPKTYAVEDFAVEEVLGLRSYRVNLRYGTFAANVMKELPPKIRQ